MSDVFFLLGNSALGLSVSACAAVARGASCAPHRAAPRGRVGLRVRVTLMSTAASGPSSASVSASAPTAADGSAVASDRARRYVRAASGCARGRMGVRVRGIATAAPPIGLVRPRSRHHQPPLAISPHSAAGSAVAFSTRGAARAAAGKRDISTAPCPDYRAGGPLRRVSLDYRCRL